MVVKLLAILILLNIALLCRGLSMLKLTQNGLCHYEPCIFY